jgi:Protein of unknown function (DUF4233)
VKRLCATVLGFEAIVIGLAIPVAIHIDHLMPRTAGLTGGIAVVLAAVLAVLARRQLAVTLVAGSLLQLFVIASGAIVPVMYILGGIFAALWVIGIRVGRSAERAAGH